MELTRRGLNVTSNPTKAPGFTLIELVIVIVILGILAATVAALSFSAKDQHSATTQADQFRRALSHAQLLAISQGNRLQLAVTAATYTVCLASVSTCDEATALPAPTLDTASGKFHVALEGGVSLTQGAGVYYFDSLGRPVAAATGGALRTGTITFGLNGVGRAADVNVSVLPVTGFAQVAY